MKGNCAGMLISLSLVACGGEAEPAKAPPPLPAAEREEAADPSWQTEAPKSVDTEVAAPAPKAKKEREEPKFKPGMSVNEAIAAVPSDWEFRGIEADVLAAPLLNPDTYAPCKLSQGHRFKLRLAVWDGKVVGATVTSPNKRLAACIDKQVRKIKYAEKVKSMNTIDYKM